MISPLSMTLYKLCLYTLVQNGVYVNFSIPLHLLKDIKLLKSLYFTWNKRKQSYNDYYLALAALGEASFDTLSCSECGDNFTPINQDGFPCYTHSPFISYLMDDQRDKRLAYNSATLKYGDEKEKFQKQSPHLQDVVEYLEGATTFDIDLWEVI